MSKWRALDDGRVLDAQVLAKLALERLDFSYIGTQCIGLFIIQIQDLSRQAGLSAKLHVEALASNNY